MNVTAPPHAEARFAPPQTSAPTVDPVSPLTDPANASFDKAPAMVAMAFGLVALITSCIAAFVIASCRREARDRRLLQGGAHLSHHTGHERVDEGCTNAKNATTQSAKAGGGLELTSSKL